MKLIIKFQRLSELKYISHLDILRTIHRALRRSALPVEYSAGFNPQPKVSFVCALPVGLISMGEYFEITMKEYIALPDFIARLNAALPSGLTILDGIELKRPEFSIGKIINSAEYCIVFEELANCGSFCSVVKEFLSADEILIEKRTKNGVKVIDAAKGIISFSCEAVSESVSVLTCVLSSCEQLTIRPADLCEAIKKYLAIDNVQYYYTRKNMLVNLDGSTADPLKFISENSNG